MLNCLRETVMHFSLYQDYNVNDKICCVEKIKEIWICISIVCEYIRKCEYILLRVIILTK